MEALQYYNGKYLKKNEISISPDDVGFSRGYAVFEYFRVEHNTPLFIEDHLDRLWASAQAFQLEIPETRQGIKNIVSTLIEKNQLGISAMKLMVTGGVSPNGFSPGEPTFLMMHLPFVQPDARLYTDGASLMTHAYHRDLPQVKSVAYAQALALEKEWKLKGHVDVLYFQNEWISEVSRSNVFVVKSGRIKTNKQDVLAGVTQKNVMLAVRNTFPLDIVNIKLQDVLDADELFITSTTKRVLPITRVDEHSIGTGRPGEITKEVSRLFEEQVKKQWAESL